MKYWILQANPKKYRIFDALEDPSRMRKWVVARYRDDIAPGDEFALWLSGKDGGVKAFGIVTGHAAPTPADNTHWEDPEENQRKIWRVGIKMGEILDSLIPRGELLDDPGFASNPIIRAPFAGNPFPVSKAEWQAIRSHCR
jgi:hypothetical protein